MVEDDTKVNLILRELNNGVPGRPWVAAPGFHIWLAFEFGKKGQQNSIKGSEGIVVKVFFNGKTGETKTVLAQAVTKDG